MYIDTETLEYPISEQQIKSLYPTTSFAVPFSPPKRFSLVFEAPKPEFDDTEFYIVEGDPVFSDKGWYEQTWQLIPLDADEIAARKQLRYEQRLQAINDEIQVKIRSKYSLEDEQYFARIGVGKALGVYEFQEGEQEALLEFGAYVESIRQWGRDERAKLAL